MILAQLLLLAAALTKVSEVGGSEGPVWNHRTGELYFTGKGRIFRMDAKGVTHVYRENSGAANGLLIDREGRLIACEAANRRVTRTELDGTITVLASEFEGQPFNSPNDLTIDSKGRIYFSDPRYGDRSSMRMKAESVYRIDAPGKVARILTLDRPNGLLVTPDNRHLFVADNNNNTPGGARKLWRFDLTPEGTVVEPTRKLIYDWGTSRGPDGIEMDSAGNLHIAGGLNQPHPPHETNEKKGGVYVLTQEGKLKEFIPVPLDEVTNIAFGGQDRRTLYISAGGTIFSIRVATPGAPLQ